MIAIDKELCVKCQKCIKVCPSMIFRMELDIIGVEFVEYCILCGHCLAICPTNAIQHEKFDHKQFKEFSKNKIDIQDLSKLFQTRRSIRNFKQDSIPQELIQSIINETRYAPTGSNLQNVEYLVLQNQAIDFFVSKVREFYAQIAELLQSSQSSNKTSTMARRVRKWNYWVEEAVKGNDMLFYNPSAIVLVYVPNSDPMKSLNIGYASAYLMLAAHVNGIGTCNIGYAVEAIKRKSEIAESIGIPEDFIVGAVISMGYPEFEYKRVPLRNPVSITWKYD